MDPNDEVVAFSAAEHLYRNCSTPEADKRLVILEGMRHDVLTNTEDDSLHVELDK